ncbi:MAG TPA: class I SAM-dependent methyltransferase [Polyangiaceae bacterium]|nr:class I SAM-dependent methyltransferase [Polyangiaceae bacterium]
MINPAALARFGTRAAGYRRRMAKGPVGALRSRERAVVRALLGLRPGDRVLDAGCGAGFDSAWIQAAGARVLGVDASEAMVAACRKAGVDAVCADLCRLSLDQRFDKAICLGALEFCSDPVGALSGIRRHLRDGGPLVALYPRRGAWGNAYQMYHRAWGVPVRLFEAVEMQQMVQRAGFEAQMDVRATAISRVVLATRKATP